MARNRTLSTLAVVAKLYGHDSAARLLNQWAGDAKMADLYLDMTAVAHMCNALGHPCMGMMVGEGCLPEDLLDLVRQHHIVLAEFRANKDSGIAHFMLTLLSRGGMPIFITADKQPRTEHGHGDLDKQLTGSYVVLAEQVDVRAVLKEVGVQIA
jgi:hypothetical protein